MTKICQTQFLEAPFATGAAKISPNGRWIAYISNESGTDEIYVSAFVPPAVDADALSLAAGGKQRVSTAGGRDPVWRRDGSELFYVAPGDALIAVAVNGAGDRLEVGAALFLMPTLSIVTTTAGWFLAEQRGFLELPYPEFWWVAAALAIVTVLTVQGLGILLPINIRVFLEFRKPEPDLARIGGWMRTYIRVIASQGIMQVAIIVVMARFVTGL